MSVYFEENHQAIGRRTTP